MAMSKKKILENLVVKDELDTLRAEVEDLSNIPPAKVASSILKLNDRSKELRAGQKLLLERVEDLTSKVENLTSRVDVLEADQKTIISILGKNRKGIEVNRKAIEVNREAIEVNRKGIEANREAIEVNRKAIEVNRKGIETNRKAIEANRVLIDGNRILIGEVIDGQKKLEIRIDKLEMGQQEIIALLRNR